MRFNARLKKPAPRPQGRSTLHPCPDVLAVIEVAQPIDSHSIVATMRGMDVEVAAKCLTELGNPARLRAYRLLVRAGSAGLTVGEIQQHLESPASTLSHHIAHLLSANLITQTREGRSMRCRVQFKTMDTLLDFLTTECCVGVSAIGQIEQNPE